MAFKSVWAFDPVEALDYDFDLSKLERVMSRAGKVAALQAPEGSPIGKMVLRKLLRFQKSKR